MSRTIETNCAHCGAIVVKPLSVYRKSKSGNLFCNRKCSTIFNNQFKSGEKHGNWNGGNGTYRQRALRHYGSVCSSEYCEITLAGITLTEEMIDIDHIDSDRSNNALENLQPLCVWCHAKKTRGVVISAC